MNGAGEDLEAAYLAASISGGIQSLNQMMTTHEKMSSDSLMLKTVDPRTFLPEKYRKGQGPQPRLHAPTHGHPQQRPQQQPQGQYNYPQQQQQQYPQIPNAPEMSVVAGDSDNMSLSNTTPGLIPIAPEHANRYLTEDELGGAPTPPPTENEAQFDTPSFQSTAFAKVDISGPSKPKAVQSEGLEATVDTLVAEIQGLKTKIGTLSKRLFQVLKHLEQDE